MAAFARSPDRRRDPTTCGPPADRRSQSAAEMWKGLDPFPIGALISLQDVLNDVVNVDILNGTVAEHKETII